MLASMSLWFLKLCSNLAPINVWSLLGHCWYSRLSETAGHALPSRDRLRWKITQSKSEMIKLCVFLGPCAPRLHQIVLAGLQFETSLTHHLWRSAHRNADTFAHVWAQQCCDYAVCVWCGQQKKKKSTHNVIEGSYSEWNNLLLRLKQHSSVGTCQIKTTTT